MTVLAHSWPIKARSSKSHVYLRHVIESYTLLVYRLFIFILTVQQ